MNKILIGVAITALLVIAGIVVYQFAEQQYAKQKISDAFDTEKKQRQIDYNNCLASGKSSLDCYNVLNGQ